MTVVLPEQPTTPSETTATGDLGPTPRRRLRSPAGRRRPRLPYLLLVPAVATMVVVLGYPLVRLGVMSLQRFGLPQQFGAPPEWVGLANFREILTDSYFWTVVLRTVVFCVVNVAITMVLGLLTALLLHALGKKMRTALSIGLLLVWAMPALTATVVWQWVFDAQYGLVNWLFTQLGGDFEGHSWLSAPLSFFAVATIVVVWMGIPFVAFTLYAGMTQVPEATMEAAAVDGAGPWARFRDVMIPTLKPLLLILAALSTLWDLRVFTQIYVLQQAGGITRETNLLGVWTYRVAIGQNRYDIGAATAIVMVAITLVLTIFYLKQMLSKEEL
ncbi:MAG: carbohydrate ABC transporter permease [Acidimicrobiales bacterium]